MTSWIMRNTHRYQQELASLRREYPAAQIVKARNTSRFCTKCSGSGSNEHLAVIASFATQFGHTYTAILVYPCDFPNRIPAVFPLRPLRNGTPHQFSDGRLCLTANEYDSVVTGAQVLGMAYGWFTCYDIWSITGKFPSRNYGEHTVRR